MVNENDTVATEEIRFGDNDRLAALVAHVVSADALVLLSDVDGVYDADPRTPGASLVREVHGGADLAGVRVGRTSSLGTGGMASKLAAADLASGAGVPVARGGGRRRPRRAGGGRGRHRVRPARAPAVRAAFWLRHMAGTRGRLHLDAGAVRAVVGRRRSLLAAGITGSDGDFEAGDVVDLVDPRGEVVARGVSAFDAEELPEISGRSSEDSPPELRREVVHADDLVPVVPTVPDPAATSPSSRGLGAGSVQKGGASSRSWSGDGVARRGGGATVGRAFRAGATFRYQSGSMSSRVSGRSSGHPSSGRGRGAAAGRGAGSGSRMVWGGWCR